MKFSSIFHSIDDHLLDSRDTKVSKMEALSLKNSQAVELQTEWKILCDEYIAGK